MAVSPTKQKLDEIVALILQVSSYEPKKGQVSAAQLIAQINEYEQLRTAPARPGVSVEPMPSLDDLSKTLRIKEVDYALFALKQIFQKQMVKIDSKFAKTTWGPDLWKEAEKALNAPERRGRYDGVVVLGLMVNKLCQLQPNNTLELLPNLNKAAYRADIDLSDIAVHSPKTATASVVTRPASSVHSTPGTTFAHADTPAKRAKISLPVSLDSVKANVDKINHIVSNLQHIPAGMKKQCLKTLLINVQKAQQEIVLHVKANPALRDNPSIQELARTLRNNRDTLMGEAKSFMAGPLPAPPRP